MKPIVLTSGEPAGIGPDICLKLSDCSFNNMRLVVTADIELLSQRMHQLGTKVTLKEYNVAGDTRCKKGELFVKHIPLTTKCLSGILNPNNAQYVLDQINFAVKGCQDNKFSALVTAPIHKAIINEAGISFQGHTEYLAKLTNMPRAVMMLASDKMKVALVTNHIPLREVPDAISSKVIIEVITLIYHELKDKFAIQSPCIIVCGLNPHAGEGGYLGSEEIEFINPAINKLRDKGFNIQGALPADSVFIDDNLKRADAIVSMYHDQGLTALKHSGFNSSVNITLGLPIIRTSVDHGTALELAGTGEADSKSLLKAIEYATFLIQNTMKK